MLISDWSSDVCSSDLNLASLASGSAQAQEYLMWALEENGQFEDALDAAERTLALDPNNTRARFGQVRYLAQLERLDEAKAKLTSLKADFPEQEIGRASCRERVCQYV